MKEEDYVIVYADKSVLQISGLKVKGLNTVQLEKILQEKLHTFVRVIGVTGENIEMDIYNIDPEQIRKNAQGLIDSISLAEGVSVTELTDLVCSDRIVPVRFDQIPDKPISDCARERWIRLASGDSGDVEK